VASGTFSPTLRHGIATAYVPAGLAVVGTPLSISVRRRGVAATVVRPPFVKQTSLSTNAS
jgi:aminomethyltransferase